MGADSPAVLSIKKRRGIKHETKLQKREREIAAREKAEKEKLDSDVSARRGRVGGRRGLLGGLETGVIIDKLGL